MSTDNTKYRINHDCDTVHVSFDLRDQENCCIELEFTKDDILSIINMEALRKEKISLSGMEGYAALGRDKSRGRLIAFSYRNKNSVNSGTVYYPYEKLSALLDKAFTELNSSCG